jgi:quinol monooxygenase YgiN
MDPSDSMIVVVGRVRADPAKRAELVKIGQALARASRQEAGCISYRLYEDTEVVNDFVFVEEWRDDEALQQHFATAHIAEFMRSAPATLLAPPEVRFHTIESSRNLSDVSGRTGKVTSGAKL